MFCVCLSEIGVHSKVKIFVYFVFDFVVAAKCLAQQAWETLWKGAHDLWAGKENEKRKTEFHTTKLDNEAVCWKLLA